MEPFGNFKHTQIATTECPGYLRFDIQGTYDFGEYQQAVSIMRNTCVEQGRSRALIHLLGMVGDIPQYDRFALGMQWAEVWGGVMKAAVVAPAEKVNRFFENTAVNRQARVQVFFEDQSALEWLMEP